MTEGDPPEETGLTVLPVAIGGDDDLPVGTRAGDYTLVERIGRGGGGAVYLATHEKDGARAAVKVLHGFLATEKLGVDRFLREVHTVKLMKHPNIIDIYETGSLPGGRPWFAMELLDGINLRRLLQTEGRLSPVETYGIVEQVCAALEAAHAVGVVHRDLKAENVIVTKGRGIRLVDFGIAKLLEPEPGVPGITTTQQMLGTPSAMAPEQIMCLTVDRRTDIYGLGILVYNMLTGVHPFRGAPEEVARMHLETPPRPPSELALLSPAVDAVVLRCLEKDREARFQTVGAFLEAFRAALFGDQTPTRVRLGVAVLVSVAAPASAGDDLLADATLALDDAEAELRRAGYQIAVQTSAEILGVTLCPPDADGELAVRRSALELAEALWPSMRGAVGDAVRVAVTVNANEVYVREGSGEIVGGPLLQIGSWSWPHDGVAVTPRAGANLPPPK